jgi:hypothetical protein
MHKSSTIKFSKYKNKNRVITYPKKYFTRVYSQYSDNQLDWMIRNGHRNGMFEKKAAVKKNNKWHIVDPNFWKWIIDGDES